MDRSVSMAILILGTALWLLVSLASHASAAATTNPSDIDEAAPSERAPVTLDGEVLFQVIGYATYPAEERAEAIKQRIIAIAADPSVAVDSLRVIEMEDRTRITAGDRFVMDIFDLDVAAQRGSRQVVAQRVLAKIGSAMTSYRNDRSPRALLIDTLYALGATAVLTLLLFLFRGAFHKLDALTERRLKYDIERLEAESHHLIHAQQLIKALHKFLKFLGILTVLATGYIYLHFVLSLYPWTRPLATQLLGIILDRLGALVMGFFTILPNLVFIAILALVARYVLKVMRLYFAGIERGTITLAGFEREWALPTYKIARWVIIAFALVVAYPYIPGSNSEAFKAVSIFFGIILSLGSSSVIANVIAGYAMIYRGAFKVGDRIVVKDLTGDVIDIRLMVTHLRTVKNEEIVVPNSDILNSHVINYSTLARSHGLILHTTVGVGYQTSWRQVEAMLRLAAERTAGLLKEPQPFILQKELGEFAVTYELNAYCDDPQRMTQLYTAMHQNILDVFNEHCVQIMTPAYEGDPETPKVVPKDQWYLPPAKPIDAPNDGHILNDEHKRT